MESKNEINPDWKADSELCLINEASKKDYLTFDFLKTDFQKNKTERSLAIVWDGSFPPSDGATFRTMSYIQGLAKHLDLTLVLAWREWSNEALQEMARDYRIKVLLVDHNLYYNTNILQEILSKYETVLIRDFEIINAISHPNIFVDCQELRFKLLHQLGADEALVEDIKAKELKALNKATKIFSISREEIGDLIGLGIPRAKLIPIHQAIDFTKFERLKLDETSNDILFLGHLTYEPNHKAVEYIAETLVPLLIEKYPKIVVHIVGFCPDDLKKYENENIKFYGSVSEEKLLEVVATCKIAIAPLTHAVGQICKVITYLASGLPTVLTTQAITGYENFIGQGISVCNIDNFHTKVLLQLSNPMKVNKQELKNYEIGVVYGKVLAEIQQVLEGE